MEANNAIREKVRARVDLIRRYVHAEEASDQTEASRLAQEQRMSRSKILDKMRIALRNQKTNFNSWYPFKNPNRLVGVGMKEGEVKSIAGEPDEKEFYVGSIDGRSLAIGGWYYINASGTKAALLEFESSTSSLIRISEAP